MPKDSAIARIMRIYTHLYPFVRSAYHWHAGHRTKHKALSRAAWHTLSSVVFLGHRPVAMEILQETLAVEAAL